MSGSFVKYMSEQSLDTSLSLVDNMSFYVVFCRWLSPSVGRSLFPASFTGTL